MLEMTGAYFAMFMALVLGVFAHRFSRWLIEQSGDQNLASIILLFTKYRKADFVSFMKSHRVSLKKAHEDGDYVMGVCNYYGLMAELITMSSGPFWHFVPMYRKLSRAQCHHKFHHTVTDYLEAKKDDTVLEIGCGYGEMGRQVAKISGASVTGLTMADVEIVGGNERIKAANLQGQCKMVQGNYHKMPFEAERFDKVFGVYTLKYSADIDAAIAEAVRVLKPGGKFVSYEILTSDKYDMSNKLHKYYVDNISTSTCMPPLWHAQAFRDAAKKAGLIPVEDVDLCGPSSGAAQWYSCFERTGIQTILTSNLVFRLVGLAEAIRVLPAGFSDWYENCIIHPTTDFVYAGRLGIVTGALMMTWKKPW